MLKMSTTGQNAFLQALDRRKWRCTLQVVDSFVDLCLRQVIPDLLQGTVSLWNGLWLFVKFVKCLKHCPQHMVVQWVEV